MSARNAWTDRENAAIVALYFRMLDKATAGYPYNKAHMIRDVRFEHGKPLGARSKSSIEAKLMNCTACHMALGYDESETMAEHGYRPLDRFQGSLRDAMKAALGADTSEQRTVSSGAMAS